MSEEQNSNAKNDEEELNSLEVKSYNLMKFNRLWRERNNSNVSSAEEHFSIPAVQRGLVWNPKQIADLWNSIIKGYPIGVITVYTAPINALEMIDGQQRSNAIGIGFDTTSETKDQPTIWVTIKDGMPKFWICTKRHPWGFKEDCSLYNAGEQYEYSQTLSGNSPMNDRHDALDMKCSYPVAADLPLPLPYLLDESGVSTYKQNIESTLRDGQGKRYFPLILLKDKERASEFIELFEKQHASKWVERIRNYEIPVIKMTMNVSQSADDTFAEADDRIIELFKLINQGGTIIQPDEMRYSVVSVLAGECSKNTNEQIADNFLTPSRLMGIILRILKADNPTSDSLPDTPGPAEDAKMMGCDKIRNTLADLLEELKNQKACGNRLLNRGASEDNPLPPRYIYLKENDEWLFVLIWMLHKFKKCEHSDQLYMLPYILTGTARSTSDFARAFYKGIHNLPKDCDFNKILFWGVVEASMSPSSMIYPFPADEATLKKALDEIILLNNDLTIGTNYQDQWLSVFIKTSGCTNNPLLLYFQRNYILRLEKQFNPAARTQWDGAYNKTWDMDHIVPHSWFKKEPYINFVANMQALHFSDNRSKGNSCVGIPSFGKDQNAEQLANYFQYPLSAFEPNSGWNGRPKENGKNYNIDVILPRFKLFIASLHKSLKIQSLIEIISSCCVDDHPCVRRFKVFKVMNGGMG